MGYQGSTLFKPLCDQLGTEVYLFNFLFVQLVALLIGLLYRSLLPPPLKQHTNRAQCIFRRHLFNIVVGLMLGYFCYGQQLIHLVLQVFGSYLGFRFLPREYSYMFVFIYSMVYMSAAHLAAQINDYGNFTLDVTCPIMVTTQKLTSLAFSFYDGSKPIESLSNDQKSQVVAKRPTLLELISYVLNFQGIIIGPLCFYKDYIEFINGDSIKKHRFEDDVDNQQQKSKEIKQPSNLRPLCSKMSIVLFWLSIFLFIGPKYPVMHNISQEVLARPFWYRVYMIYLTIYCQKAKFYLTWTLADAVNNASGLGFNGYKASGEPQWNLVTNINIFKLETITSVKSFFDNWNIQTQTWLRRIAYDRLSTGKTLGVMVLSAFWHGFYPGYYVGFVLSAFLVYAGRGIRRKIRPYFQTNALLKRFYSLITFLVATFTINVAGVIFYLISLDNILIFNNSMYWIVYIVSVLLTLVLPGGSTKQHHQQKTK